MANLKISVKQGFPEVVRVLFFVSKICKYLRNERIITEGNMQLVASRRSLDVRANCFYLFLRILPYCARKFTGHVIHQTRAKY